MISWQFDHRYRIDFFGKGFSSKKAMEDHPDEPDVEVKASVSGPDPGYIATSRMFSQLALVGKYVSCGSRTRDLAHGKQWSYPLRYC